ncbi:MAG TPA: endo-1,4-beta-xylanase [Bacteroidota bacterium]|nr:endo-1,4-beta-xylanase [Bacteroidota bacterium]
MNERVRWICGGALLLSLALWGVPRAAAQPLARGKGKFLGCSLGAVRSDFTQYWNQVTPEDAGKWGSVEYTQGTFTWAGVNAEYNLALNNGLPFKYHNLVWGNEQPSWITSLDSVSQRAAVVTWIDTVAYGFGSSSLVDVVNEPLHAPPPYMNALGGKGSTGWDWLVNSFTLARADFFPGVKLLVNDYNILQSNTVTDSYIGIIDTLRARKLIDGIGIQGHYFEFKSPQGATPAYSYPVSTLKENLDRLTALGLPVYISEFDIDEASDSVQLANYQTYFPLFWEDPGVKGMTLWGYVQGLTWKPNAYLVRTDGSERPALRWLRQYLARPWWPLLDSPVGGTGLPRNTTLVWNAAASALTYRVQVSLSGTFAAVALDTTIADTTIQLSPLGANLTYFWRVSAANDSGASSFSAPASFTTGDQVAGISPAPAAPAEWALAQNYPNPFNPATTIEFTVPVRSPVRLVLVDMLGSVVREIAAGTYGPGTYAVRLDGSGLASGAYLCRMDTPAFRGVRKILLVK